MRNYIISIAAAAVICVIVGNLISDKTPNGQILKLLCGILMTITALTPVLDIGFDHITDYFGALTVDADRYVANGTSASQSSAAAIIKSQTEAYILDKANTMGLEIAVEVQLDESKNQIPCSVIITGTASPYTKSRLGSYITQTLGIPEENQRWG